MTKWVHSRRSFWRRCLSKYQPAAYAKSVAPHPRPPLVEHLFSGALDHGGPRYWAFKTVEQRDAFVELYRTAEACEAPLA